MTRSFLLALVFAFSFTNAFITDIEVDASRGLVYVARDSGVLYSLDSAQLTQQAAVNTPGTVEFNTLFVGNTALYAYVSSDTAQNLDYFNFPLGSGTLVPDGSVSLAPGQSRPSIYDNTDQIGVFSVSRNLTLVNLNSLTVLDSFRYYGNRIFGVNLIYNHENKHLIIFYSAVPVNADYGLSVKEYSLSSGRFVEETTTYNCECAEPYNKTASPFYKVVLNEGDCVINYKTSPARIWCGYGEGSRFFSFNAANLADYTVVHTASPFDAVAWDFDNSVAYGIYANANDYTTQSYSVAKIRLDTGVVVATYTGTDHIIDSSVFGLDSVNSHLYLAVYDETVGASAKIVSIDTATMTSARTVSLA